MPKVTGIANWARVHQADKYDNFSIKVDVPDEFPKLLKAEKVKSQCQVIDHDVESEIHDPNAKFCFNFKKPRFLRSGAEVPGPTVVDAQTNAIPPNVLIGNGSKVTIQYHTYPYGDDGFQRLILDGVQVVDLVEFVSKGVQPPESEFEAVAGYVADETGDI